jgi:hypothetical protein
MHVFAHLPPEERSVPEGPGVPIPGLGTAFASFEAAPGAPDPILSLSDAWIGYGPFLLPFRNASGVLRFPTGLMLIENARGVLGGAPARLNARWDQVADTIDIDIEYEDGVAPPASDPGPAWASGHFESDLISLGDWPLEVVAGDFSITGSTVSVQDVTAYLEGGAVQTNGTMSLAEEEAAPFGFSIEVVGADGAGIVQILELEDGTLTGEVDASGTIAGRLSPERLFLEDAEVRLRTECHGGTVGNLPARMLIARLATPLGWTSVFTGRELPLEQMTADIEIDHGILRTENFVLESPEVRALAAGEIDVLSDDLQTDMVMALLFLQTVDQVLERVPLVGRWILGQDKSLVALYIHMEGPWDNPKGTVMPPSSIATATGWAGRMIGGGVRRVRDLLTGPPRLPDDQNGAGAPDVAPQTNGTSDAGKSGGDGASAGQDPEP